MKKIRNKIPHLLFLLISSLLCMTYITENVVQFQIVIFIILIFLSVWSLKLGISSRYKPLYSIMIVFSILYFMRACVDLEILGRTQTLFGNDNTVYVFILVGVFLQFFIVPRLKLDGSSFSWFFFIFSLMILCSLFISFRNIISGEIVLSSDSRIQADERLGVIQYGHLGLTAIIMGIIMFMKKKEFKLFLLISPLLLSVGFFSLIMSGTRSALVGLFVILFMLVITRLKVKTIIISSILLVVFGLFASNILNYTESLGANSAMRMFRFLSEGGDQSSGRLDIWKMALGEILDSPIYGVSCFIDFAKYKVDYLHNSFIEVTYSLGLLGLLAFSMINLFAIVTCYKIFKLRNIDYMCFSMLYIQYLTYTMFSESIVRLPEFWYFLSMVICIGFHYIPVKKTIKKNDINYYSNL